MVPSTVKLLLSAGAEVLLVEVVVEVDEVDEVDEVEEVEFVPVSSSLLHDTITTGAANTSNTRGRKNFFMVFLS
jgi:hypothetical protein